MRKEPKEMDKSKWYYENARTNEFSDVRSSADWWAENGDCVNYWRWSDFSQEWEILMVREP